MSKAKKAPESAEKDLTLDDLVGQSTDGLKQAEALFYQQLGVKNFVDSLKKEGYELVKKKADV